MVKGLDYALLNKVRSEIDKKPDAGEENDGKPKYVTLFSSLEAWNLFLPFLTFLLWLVGSS